MSDYDPDGIDSRENSAARVAAYVPHPKVIRAAQKVYAAKRYRGTTESLTAAKRAAEAAIRETDRLAGTSYTDAKLRFGHELSSAALRIAKEVAAAHAEMLIVEKRKVGRRPVRGRR